VGRTAECVHDPPSTPFSTLVLYATQTVEERSAGADERQTCIGLCRGGTISPVLSYESVHCELGGVQNTVQVHLDRLQARRLRRVFRACQLWC
jgi:hypothetical protein